MSNQEKPKVLVVGAGVSGLVCALELERQGYTPTIIERTERVGGRVKTDVNDGMYYDHGFQVLLTAYPAARKYLDFDALDLKKFLPGSVIFINGKQYWFGDPLRNSKFLLKTAFCPLGSFRDKLKIYQLAQRLKSTSIPEIFDRDETSTLTYLQQQGFSEQMIRNFFGPFFSGIFLESDLRTSSRMFEFVYKMFATGYAAIPAAGIQAIPNQLKSRLSNTNFLFNETVVRVEDHQVELARGKLLPYDALVIATDPEQLLPDYPKVYWKSCVNFYFKTEASVVDAPIIGLVPNPDSLINNFHFVSDVLPNKKGEHILSVTVLNGDERGPEELAGLVKQDLARDSGIRVKQLVRRYIIPYALPDLSDLRYAPEQADVHYRGNIFLAGDVTANGSLNAAMEAGRVAAEAATRKLPRVK